MYMFTGSRGALLESDISWLDRAVDKLISVHSSVLLLDMFYKLVAFGVISYSIWQACFSYARVVSM